MVAQKARQAELQVTASNPCILLRNGRFLQRMNAFGATPISTQFEPPLVHLRAADFITPGPLGRPDGLHQEDFSDSDRLFLYCNIIAYNRFCKI